MIRIIGKQGCSRCISTKNNFSEKQIEYTYELIEKLPEEEQEKLLTLAEQNNLLSFPIVIDEEGNIIK